MAFISVRGLNYFFDHQNIRPGAQTVIFLNGIMNGIESWKHYVQTIHRMGSNTLTFEYRGQWRSEFSAVPFRLGDLIDDLKTLLDLLEIPQAHLVGTSYGGMVGQLFAALNPARVLSLALIATTARIRPASFEIIKFWRDVAEQGDVEALFRAMAPSLFCERTLREQPELPTRGLRGLKNAVSELPNFCRGQVLLHDAHFADMLGDGITERLTQIQCPTLIVSGEHDVLYPPADSSYMAARIAGSEHLIVADAGHVLILERPVALNIALSGHFARLLKRQ
jgi:3-oxoadipate enol-lactonase